MTGQYEAYGLCIASEIPLPELAIRRTTCASPDVWISVGDVPERLRSPVTQSRRHQSSPEGLLLRIEDVASYFVHSGSHIVIAPEPLADPHDVRVFVLGTCFGALLHQRGVLVLHASGIGTADGAVLFAGDSGAGTSTLLAEMLRRGHRMMVDDVCAVVAPDASDDPPVVLPSYPRTRVWTDTARYVGVDTTGLQRTRAHMDKYERQLPDQFWDRPAPLRRIYQLTADERQGVAFTRLPPLLVLPVIVATTYRKAFIGGFGTHLQHFDLASRIAQHVPVVRVIRPTTTFDLEDLADRVIADLAQS